ncbi:MAG: efflux RND transporter periplasmic adaptor subunit [Bacteroidetes bacterium]|nr:MAG: efflux RND transporter periplasmic adaptor subunit [Bacteroidota bacterium]
MAKKKNATKRLFIFIGALVGLIIVLGVVVSATGLIGSGERPKDVEIEIVGIRSVTQVVTASGKMQPEIEVKISPDVSGEIIELPVKEGDPVLRGMLLVRIRPDFYEAQVEQADASVLQSKANQAQRQADLLNAEFELNKQERLYESKAISETEYMTTKTRFATSTAALEAAHYSVKINEAMLSESLEQLSKTSIYAPMDGTVSILNVELGERVVGTTQFAGTEMMRVAKLDRMELEVDVNENDVVNVSVGDTAAVEIDAYPDRTFNGIVTEIANSARIQGSGTSEQITNFPVKIRILDPHNISFESSGANNVVSNSEIPMESAVTPNFRPGMSGTVDVFTETIAAAISVPIQAVTVRDFNQLDYEDDGDSELSDNGVESRRNDEEDLRRVVFLMVDEHAKMVEVETGIQDDTHIAIMSGVSEGEIVVIGPYRVVSRTLEPNDPIREKEEEPRDRSS